MRDSRCWYFLVASSELGEGVLVFKGCANYRRLPAAGRGGGEPSVERSFPFFASSFLR